MKYYFVNLGLHLLVTIILIVLLIITTNRNKKGKTSRGVWFFLPVVLSIAVVFHLAVYTTPRLMDIKSVVTNSARESDGIVESISPLNNYIIVDGEKYFINPKHSYPETGTRVQFTCAPNSHVILELSLYNESVSQDS